MSITKYKTKKTHKENLRPGDVILVDGCMRTLSRSDFRRDSFMGVVVRGSAYPYRTQILLYDAKDQSYKPGSALQ